LNKDKQKPSSKFNPKEKDSTQKKLDDVVKEFEDGGW